MSRWSDLGDLHAGARLNVSFHLADLIAVVYQAGVAQARGNLTVTLDADLQDQPESISAPVAAIDAGLDVMCAWPAKRQDPVPKVALSWIFNAVARLATGVQSGRPTRDASD